MAAKEAIARGARRRLRDEVSGGLRSGSQNEVPPKVPSVEDVPHSAAMEDRSDFAAIQK